MAERKGETFIFKKPPVATAGAGVAGKTEGLGPIRSVFDFVL